ncbi:LamG domain-containing protein [Acidobacteria bacterium AH-259-G07]|nr:LamG domain-containing protein [Acidobacteria bacterium AH-259-G07]
MSTACQSSRRVADLCLALCLSVSVSVTALSQRPSRSEQAGLLFYLSGENGTIADVAGGDPRPSVVKDVKTIPDGAIGSGFECPHFTQILAYWAAGNIYAQRGSLAFFWRARDPIGSTPFPIFQVSYTDHSALDMAWLRIDFNGQGFDAFVTDASLARARVSYTTSALPEPDQWVHLALTWDENRGVRFYVDGRLVGQQDVEAVFYAGLDQFGAHGDVIGPQDVATMEQFLRGGDIDEIRIYDQMLSGENVARLARLAWLARGETPTGMEPLVRDLSEPVYRQEWWLRYGFNRPGDIPPYLEASSMSVRKVEIHEVYDLKQWFWKGNDGIRETTWPGVYNRSRLPGRDDYFPRPDWNCYSLSGKSVTFTLPEEPWNHLEITGSAFGWLTYLGFDPERQQHGERPLFDRPRGQERTVHRLQEPLVGGQVRFVNEEQERPIGEFSAYYVSAGQAPEGLTRLSYTMTGTVEPDNQTLESLIRYIEGRFMPEERSMMVALPAGAPAAARRSHIEHPLPLVHILVPFEFRLGARPNRQGQRLSASQVDFSTGGKSSAYSYTWESLNGGLDGIAIDLPALNVRPTHGEYFPLNIQVKDPLWPDRNLLDFTFSVRPGEARTLWLDTRDRILPNGYPLYITLAGAGADFDAADIEGAKLNLVFKDRKEAAVEHEIDRFTQVRDNQGNIVEWHTNKKTLRLYDRVSRDLTDLLRINPDHEKGLYYWSFINPEQGWPAFDQPAAAADVPLWAFRQVHLLKLFKQFIYWWIDNRQIENGEFGGGLSDDGDLTHLWVGAALMGIEPKKLANSVHRLLEAIYENGMFTNGLNTIMTDQLHTYEEGVNVQPQVMALEYGDPKIVERIMETSKALERITGIDALGHRHIRSSYFSGTQISEDRVWARAKLNFYSHLILHPALVLVEYNGHPRIKQLILELADGLLAHRKRHRDKNYYLPGEIVFPSGKEEGKAFTLGWRTTSDLVHLFWAAWRWTGDEKYLSPMYDGINQDDEFDVLRYLSANAMDLLDKRQSWGPQVLSILSRVGTPEGLLASGYARSHREKSWLTTRAARSDFLCHLAWQVTGGKKFLEEYYASQIQAVAQRMSMYTEDHWWIDQVGFPSTELQRSRLGGAAAFRMITYPGHVVSWEFKPPATAESVALLVPEATTKAVKIIAFNVEESPVAGVMTAWDMEAGRWELTVGIDSNSNDKANTIRRREIVDLERSKQLELVFEPKSTTIVELKLKSRRTPTWERPDLGLGREDVKVQGDHIMVRVHSLGSVRAPASTVVLHDPSGKTVASSRVPALEAPLDLLPKTAEVNLQIPVGRDLRGYVVRIDPEDGIHEITNQNNSVVLH